MALHLPDDENKKKNLMLKKIPLFDLLELLEKLYSQGVDYVDVSGVSRGDDEKDEIKIGIRADYVNREEMQFQEEEEEDEEEMPFIPIEEYKRIGPPEETKLNRDNINDLLA